MRIRTIVNLTEAHKARIVSRNEPFPQRICTFEISPEKAEIISRLSGNYTVTREVGLGDPAQDCVVIIAVGEESYKRLSVEKVNGYDETGYFKQIQDPIDLRDILAEAYSTGTITQGANIDFALDIMAEAQRRREAIEENNKVVQAEKARKEEEERPVREAQKQREDEEKAALKKIVAEKEATAEAEAAVRNQAIEAEKKAWIEQNGSERLQKGYALGYNCQKIYEIERAQSVLGSEYVRDSQEVDEKDRSCPSLEALQEVERLKSVIEKGAVIIWLPHGISGEDESGCEAVKADPGTFSNKYFFRTF